MYLEGFDWFNKKRWNETLTRTSFSDGGNFHDAMTLERDPSFGNRWTYVTPQCETQYNKALQSESEE